MPDAGTFSLSFLTDEPQTLLINAPGYFSQAHVISPPFNPDTPSIFTLQKQNGTQEMAWADGRLVVPEITEATIGENQLELVNGWLWGSGGNSHTTLRAGSTVIILHQARFALARPSDSRESWFYLFSGEAQITNTDYPEPIQMMAGQMVHLTGGYERYVALPIEPAVIAVMQPDPQPPAPVWPTEFREQFRNQLALLGVRMAEVITFITYLSVLFSLFLVPLYLLLSKRRHTYGKE
jgi:hypothetical protein